MFSSTAVETYAAAAIAWSFYFKLRSRAESSPTAIARRLAAARRTEIAEIISKAPRPMIGYDVGYDTDSHTFSFRSPHGIITAVHPISRQDGSIPAYSRDCQVVEPLWPASDSTWLLVPDASGAWCYYDSALGSTSWVPPHGSGPLESRQLVAPPEPFTDSPPLLDSRLTLGYADRVDWMPIYRDAESVVLLRHRLTGAVREAPWISLRTAMGGIYFANLVTRDSRWFPPHRWMDGWVTRGHRAVRGSDTLDQCDPFVGSFYSRSLLPPEISRLRVEGGAPYLHSYGVPQYESDRFDSVHSHPLVAATA